MDTNRLVQAVLILLLAIQLILTVELLVSSISRHKEDKKFWKKMNEEQDLTIARLKMEKAFIERRLSAEMPENTEINENEDNEKIN